MTKLEKIIQGKPYIIGETCFKLKSPDGVYRWNRIDNGIIGFNNKNKTWDYISNLKKLKLEKFINENSPENFYYDSIGVNTVKLCGNKDIKFSEEELKEHLYSYISDHDRYIYILENLYNKNSNFLHDFLYDVARDRLLELYPECNTIKIINKINIQTINDLYSEFNQENSELRAKYENYILDHKIVDSINTNISKYKKKIEKIEKELEEYKNSSFYYCKDARTAIRLGYFPDISNNLFFKELYSDKKVFAINYKRQLNYNANNESDTFFKTCVEYHSHKNTNRILDFNLIKLAKAMKGLTFGLEFETSSGAIPEILLNSIGLIPLKDGSITGYEYATVPMGGNLKIENRDFVITPNVNDLTKDLGTIIETCKLLSKYTKIDAYCSAHVHIGNIPTDKLFTVAFYILCRKLQEELFETQPYFKQDSPKYINAKKNYCKKLPDLGLENKELYQFKNEEEFHFKLNEAYSEIFYFLSNGYNIGPNYNRTRKVHPLGKKWERTERYNWINLVNSVFNKVPTIEFRLHSATTNPYKIINWMLICNAMIKFTENNIKEILNDEIPLNLDTVIKGYCTNFRSKKNSNQYGEFLYNYLSEYIRQRKEYFRKDLNNLDFISEAEFKNDAEYVYEYEGKTLF